MEPKLLTGRCDCGAVRFEIAAPLGPARYCHCTSCQRRTGTAASASAITAQGSVVVTQGVEELRGWAPEGRRERVFCGLCGSHLFIRHPETGEFAGVRLGAIDGDPGVRPAGRPVVANAPGWEPLPDHGLARPHERQPRG